MQQIQIPLNIIYETDVPTPISDVIVSLQSVEAISKDAVSLLPSLINGLQVEKCSLNVPSLEEGSLREAFFLAMLVTYQPELAKEVPDMIETLFSVKVHDKYDTITTVVFLIVLFYGVGLAIDVAKKAFTDSLPRQKFNELVDILAHETGKPASEIREIIEARFQQPAAAKRIVKGAKSFSYQAKNTVTRQFYLTEIELAAALLVRCHIRPLQTKPKISIDINLIQPLSLSCTLRIATRAPQVGLQLLEKYQISA